MQKDLSERKSVLLGLFHIASLLVGALTAAAVDSQSWTGSRLRRSTNRNARPGVVEESTDVGCRCAADQWEGVLRSVDRAFYVEGLTMDPDLEGPGGGRLRAAEMETNTAMHYDYSNGLFASHDYDTGANTIIDYNIGVQYVVEGRKCRVRPASKVMNRMCVPEVAQFDGEFRLRSNERVAMWKAVGPNNATLHAIVSLERCLPVSEETLSLEHDYALLTSSRYVDVQVGISDRRVFDVPEQCRRAVRPRVSEPRPRPPTKRE